MYLLLVIDGDGLSKIAALFILADELKSTVENIVKVFQKHSELWTETKVIMSDKDLVEREAFSKCFSSASLLICLYHTLKCFRRKVTCEKMEITSAERLRCMEIIQLRAYSKTPEDYTKKLEMLKNTKLGSVISYFMENWDSIKDQWVFAFKDSHMNLGETTNNRLELTFNKLKNVCSKYASLMHFFLEFFTFLGAIRNDRNHHHLMTLSRKKIALPCAAKKDEIEYLEQLTPQAFSFVRRQLKLIDKEAEINRVDKNIYILNYILCKKHNLTVTSFDSSFMKTMGLPCTHLLKLRPYLSLPLYDSSLANKRWTKSYYILSSDARFSESNIPAECESTTITETEEANSQILSQSQKFDKLTRTCQILASIGREGGMKQFELRHKQLQKIMEQWKIGKEIAIIESKEKIDIGRR